MLQESIGLSVILSFLTGEFLGISAGGLVSPGYLAFFLEQPLRVASTILLAIIIFLSVRGLQKFLIIFGRRRFMATILLSLAGTWLFEQFFFYANGMSQDMRIIGYIIPGLIANDMIKQGVLKTIVMVILVAIVVRFIVMLVAF